jgi:hypothetical protein
VKITFDPSLLNVAECQLAKFLSTTWSSRTGFTGSEISIRMPLPEQAPAARPTSGKTVIVMTLIGHPRALRPRPVVATLPEPRDVAGRRVGKDAGPVDDARLFWRGEGHLDDVDAEERGVRIFFGILARAIGELLG